SSGTLWLGSTEVGCLQDRPQRSLGRHRVIADEFLVRRDDAAEILRPRAIEAAIDDHVADLLLTKLLRNRRKADQCINLPISQELHRLRHEVEDEIDIPLGVDADM